MAQKRKKQIGYPSGQPCGLDYKSFRSGWTFKDAYEHVAYGRGEGYRTITPNVVRRELSRLKKLEFERYNEDCGRYAPPEHIRSSDCTRICRERSNPCGKGCVSKRKTCRRPVERGVCSISDFQMPLQFNAPPQYDASEFLDGLKRRGKRRRK